MHTETPNSATGFGDAGTAWRDFADKLTAAQIEQFERYESHFSDPAESAWMAVEARELVERNATDAAMFARLPIPAGAVRVELADQDGDGNWYRNFDGTARTVGGVRVDIEGVQYSDGRIERRLTVTSSDLPNGPVLTTGQAREIAAALVEFADTLDRLDGGAL